MLQDIFELFSSLVDLPEETLSPLKRAMELREIDFTRLPLGEVPLSRFRTRYRLTLDDTGFETVTVFDLTLPLSDKNPALCF